MCKVFSTDILCVRCAQMLRRPLRKGRGKNYMFVFVLCQKGPNPGLLYRAGLQNCDFIKKERGQFLQIMTLSLQAAFPPSQVNLNRI